jgi:uncharacterized spore protein YtfJ
MNQETNLTSMENLGDSTTKAVTSVKETLELFLESASVDRVYGEPIEHGDTVIIPAAEVLVGLGFGTGAGFGTSGTEAGEEGNGNGANAGGGGGGGGGGGRTFSRPVAVIVSSPEGVRVQEVVDPTKIALAAFTTGGFMVAMLLRMIKPSKAMRQLKQS